MDFSKSISWFFSSFCSSLIRRPANRHFWKSPKTFWSACCRVRQHSTLRKGLKPVHHSPTKVLPSKTRAPESRFTTTITHSQKVRAAFSNEFTPKPRLIFPGLNEHRVHCLLTAKISFHTLRVIFFLYLFKNIQLASFFPEPFAAFSQPAVTSRSFSFELREHCTIICQVDSETIFTVATICVCIVALFCDAFQSPTMHVTLIMNIVYFLAHISMFTSF